MSDEKSSLEMLREIHAAVVGSTLRGPGSDGVKLGKVYAEGHTQLTVTYRGVEYSGWMEKCGNIVRFIEEIPPGATELLFKWGNGKVTPPEPDYTLCA